MAAPGQPRHAQRETGPGFRRVLQPAHNSPQVLAACCPRSRGGGRVDQRLQPPHTRLALRAPAHPKQAGEGGPGWKGGGGNASWPPAAAAGGNSSPPQPRRCSPDGHKLEHCLAVVAKIRVQGDALHGVALVLEVGEAQAVEHGDLLQQQTAGSPGSRPCIASPTQTGWPSPAAAAACCSPTRLCCLNGRTAEGAPAAGGWTADHRPGAQCCRCPGPAEPAPHVCRVAAAGRADPTSPPYWPAPHGSQINTGASLKHAAGVAGRRAVGTAPPSLPLTTPLREPCSGARRLLSASSTRTAPAMVACPTIKCPHSWLAHGLAATQRHRCRQHEPCSTQRSPYLLHESGRWLLKASEGVSSWCVLSWVSVLV